MNGEDDGMATPVRWGSLDVARLTPPAVADPRGRAMVETVASLLREAPLTDLLLADPWTVDARALPALIAAAGISDLIEPGLPVAHARALLAEARAINERRGRVAGIRWALGTVGIAAEIVQWHQAQPKRTPNTYEISIRAEAQIIPDDGGGNGPLINAATQRQVVRLVDATKRWSQQGDVVFSAGVGASVGLATAGMMIGVLDIPTEPVLERAGGATIRMAAGAAVAGLAAAVPADAPPPPVIDGPAVRFASPFADLVLSGTAAGTAGVPDVFVTLEAA